MEERGIATGLLLAVFGLWLILRTVNRDASHRTLVDRIMGAHPAVAQ
jgi:hypothetical protein